MCSYLVETNSRCACECCLVKQVGWLAQQESLIIYNKFWMLGLVFYDGSMEGSLGYNVSFPLDLVVLEP